VGEHFIATDNQVAVTWSDARPDGFSVPRLGKPETDVIVPISFHVALIGRFEDVPKTLALSRQRRCGGEQQNTRLFRSVHWPSTKRRS
jgi:hypothetical protein